MTVPDVGFSTLLWMTVFTFVVAQGDLFSHGLGQFERVPSLRSRKTVFSFPPVILEEGASPTKDLEYELRFACLPKPR